MCGCSRAEYNKSKCMLQVGVDDREEPELLREEVEAIASGSINKSKFSNTAGRSFCRVGPTDNTSFRDRPH